MKAYKGFNKDMTCRGFQYEEGKEYETERAELCDEGFHACENPLDCFNYYVPANSVYHEVEIEDNGQRGNDSKVVGKKIKIGAKIDIKGIVKAAIDFVFASTKATAGYNSNSATAGRYSNSATAGDNSNSATAGNNSNSATAGDNSNSATAGYNSNSATAGRYSNSATAGRYSNSATAGDNSNSATAGYNSNSATAGYNSNSATAGRYSNSATAGRYSNSATAGDNSNSATAGNNSNSATAGDNSNSATAGDNSNSATAGDNSNSATAGRYSNSATAGDNSNSEVKEIGGVAAALGYNCKAKACVGSAICLVERDRWNGEGCPLLAIKAAIVDGEKIKADTWYKLENGEFVEVNENE